MSLSRCELTIHTRYFSRCNDTLMTILRQIRNLSRLPKLEFINISIHIGPDGSSEQLRVIFNCLSEQAWPTLKTMKVRVFQMDEIEDLQDQSKNDLHYIEPEHTNVPGIAEVTLRVYSDVDHYLNALPRNIEGILQWGRKDRCVGRAVLW